jgi:dynein heavy chain
LSRLIGKEQKSLEEQLDQLQKEVVANNTTLADLEGQLLDRLANSEGSLIDDTELIDVLANIKVKSKEIAEKLEEAAEKKIDINDKREIFRPCAARGAVLYFCIVEMANVEWMYSTSLTQFLALYDYAIEASPKAQLIKERVQNITQWLTRRTYRYINRGLYEKDKTTFKLMMSTRIMIKDKKLNSADILLFLKAGAGMEDRAKLFNWMDNNAWLNLKALSKHKFLSDTQAFYKALPDQMQRNEAAWKKWIDENEPEKCPVPDGYEEKLSTKVVLALSRDSA